MSEIFFVEFVDIFRCLEVSLPFKVHRYMAPVGGAEREAKSVPLLAIVHGGPQGAQLNTWHYRSL